MITEERYSVPLTLQEIKALLNSHCHHTLLRQHHSAALQQLEDVWQQFCESELASITDNSTPVNE